MTIATIETTMTSTLSGVSGVGDVHDRIRTDTDRAGAEADYIDAASGKINSWEFEVNTKWDHDGAGGLGRTEVTFRVIAHYFHDDDADSRGTFRDLIDAVMKVLGPAYTGLKEDGIVLDEPPTLVKLRTGHTAYRAHISGTLWDDTVD